MKDDPVTVEDLRRELAAALDRAKELEEENHHLRIQVRSHMADIASIRSQYLSGKKGR